MKGKVIKKLFERKKERLQRSPLKSLAEFWSIYKETTQWQKSCHHLKSVYVAISELMESSDTCTLSSGYELDLHSHCPEVVLIEVRSKIHKESTDSLQLKCTLQQNLTLFTRIQWTFSKKLYKVHNWHHSIKNYIA